MTMAWQPIATAPLDGTGVLLIDMGAERPQAGCGWFLFGKWSCVDPDGEEADPALFHAMTWVSPTHWMPLPRALEQPELPAAYSREVMRYRATLPDYIDLFRTIRAAGRKDADKAKAVARLLGITE